MRCQDLPIKKLCATCSQEKPFNSGYCYVEEWHQLYPYLLDRSVLRDENLRSWLKDLILINSKSTQALDSLLIMLENFYPEHYELARKWIVLL